MGTASLTDSTTASTRQRDEVSQATSPAPQLLGSVFFSSELTDPQSTLRPAGAWLEKEEPLVSFLEGFTGLVGRTARMHAGVPRSQPDGSWGPYLPPFFLCQLWSFPGKGMQERKQQVRLGRERKEKPFLLVRSSSNHLC